MDEKKIQPFIAELSKGLKTEASLNQFYRMLPKLTVGTALNAELADHIVYEKNAPQNVQIPETATRQKCCVAIMADPN
ncbi:transposase [Salmonella enterica subsp. enterica serovar Salford]|nr:transposase [Salmonella enterica subsp. enterica serovar Salford]